jgi:transmembrane sensor
MIRNPEFDDSGRLQSADPVAQAAAEWVVRRDRGLTAEEVRTLAEWLDADPRHSVEFARIANSWQRLDVIGAVPGLVAMADAIEMRARARRQRQRTWAAAAGVAVAASIVAAFGLWRSVRSSGPAEPKKGDYIVLASTARHMAMPDGSVAELNGDSRIVMDFNPTERRVKLVHGEAHFSVAKNPARPFIVSAGSIAVRAVGTAFDVRIAADSVEVLVTEGKVHLQESAHASGQQPLPEKPIDSVSSGRALSAGERAVVQAAVAGRVTVSVDLASQSEIDRTLAWEGTQLAFDRTPFDQVVAIFNHFNSRQLVLADPNLRRLTLSGVFRADNLDAFVHLLRASVDVVAEPQDDGRILLRAAP